MNLSKTVFILFQNFHRGKDHSIKLIDLCFELNGNRPKNLWYRTEREIRKAYESLPICGTNFGLFLIDSEEERQNQIELHKKKIRAYAKKIKILKQYKINSDPFQGNLF